MPTLETELLRPDGPPPVAEPRVPRVVLPDQACDSHCHIYGPFDRFPLPPDRTFTPNEAPETALRRLHDRLGLKRAVIVHSKGHGMDHGPVLDALKAGNGRYRGVALIEPDASQDVLRTFDAAGICGVRFNFMAHLGGKPDLDKVRTVIRLVEPLGWHIEIHVAGRDVVELEEFIRLIRAPVVIDHMARVNVDEGPNGPAMRTLRGLLDTGRIWVKVSGADRLQSLALRSAMSCGSRAVSLSMRQNASCGGATGRTSTCMVPCRMTVTSWTSSVKSHPTTTPVV